MTPNEYDDPDMPHGNRPNEKVQSTNPTVHLLQTIEGNAQAAYLLFAAAGKKTPSFYNCINLIERAANELNIVVEENPTSTGSRRCSLRSLSDNRL